MKLSDYIVNIFKKFNIIGLGEGGHGLENSHHIFQDMLDDKQIQEVLDILIVEFANERYQSILDKYIFGEDVELHDLKNVWRETTSPGQLGELPIYFELLKKIREINTNLNKKIRVLAGDPLIDWDSIHSSSDRKNQIGYKIETNPAELAIEFGIGQNKKVLIIYSEFHLTKIPHKLTDQNYPTITSIVNNAKPNSMNVIGTIYTESFLSEIKSKNYASGSVIDLNNSNIGEINAGHFFQSSIYKNGTEIKVFENYKIKELFDALLYVGQFEALKRSPIPEPNFENEYLKELNRRRKIVGLKPIKHLI